jgi:hypothetical protein
VVPFVLFIGDLFHPVGGLGIEMFLDGDVGYGCGWRGSMPVLLARREPDHVTRPDFLHRAAPPLCPPATGRHDQVLTERVSVPCCPRAGLEGDAGTDNTRRSGRVEQRVNAHGAGKIFCRPFAGRL